MTFAMFAANGPTIIILCILGVILFGRRLPEMGRSIGKSLKEFQKGMHGIEDDVTEASSPSDQPRAQLQAPPRVSTAVPRFDDNHVTTNNPPPAV